MAQRNWAHSGRTRVGTTDYVKPKPMEGQSMEVISTPFIFASSPCKKKQKQNKAKQNKKTPPSCQIPKYSCQTWLEKHKFIN